MRESLLSALREISPEEQEILDGKSIDWQRYTDQTAFEVESEKLLSIGDYITVRPNTRFADFPLHGHNYVELMYVCSGTITHIIDGREIVMHSGDLLFMNQHVKHAVKKASENDIGLNFIILPAFFDTPLVMLKKDGGGVLEAFLVDALALNSGAPQYLHFHCGGNRAIENLMENITESLLSDARRDDTINQVTMGLIFLHLSNNMDTIGADSAQDYEDLLVSAALQYIRNHYRDASLTVFAEKMHHSVSSMSKIIKKRTGARFLDLVLRQRFRQTLTYLLETDMTVQEIMQAVGYENSTYFYHAFRARFKMSPYEYRKLHKDDEKIRL